MTRTVIQSDVDKVVMAKLCYEVRESFQSLTILVTEVIMLESDTS